MAINFPNTPASNDTYTVGSNTWLYDGEKWVLVASTIELDDLSDVSVPTPSSGQFLKWDGTAWVADSIPTINYLDDIGDVSASSPSSGDFLKWNGTEWVPDSVPTINFLDDIGDVVVSSASATQVLTYDGTNWVNQNPSIGSGNLDGGTAVTIYGGVFALSGGSA